jgi:hypothetical protein
VEEYLLSMLEAWVQSPVLPKKKMRKLIVAYFTIY